MSFSIPVVFIIFRRPETTKKVFDEIRKIKPSHLFIIADGPRNSDEGILCQKAREISEIIDWECQVSRDYSSKNLGCKRRITSGLDWVFSNVEKAIILEDDCLPNQSFFRYCEELLNRYENDERIMLISGFNRQGKWKESDNDYFFSHLGGIWGWASWRRAWQLNDPEMTGFDTFSKQNYFEYLLGSDLGRLRKSQMIDVLNRKIDTWDYQWGFSRHVNSGLACVPSRSLIENIGFGEDATHTFNNDFKPNKAYELTFPLKENRFFVADFDYDKLFFSNSKTNGNKRVFKKLISYLIKIKCKLIQRFSL